MEKPKFTLQDVKYADDEAMFVRAEDLFRRGKVKRIREDTRGYSATVESTHDYDVSVSKRHADAGYCDCYMGQNDMLCKHMMALALAVLDATDGLAENAVPKGAAEAKKQISAGIRKFRAYTGPSKIWFAYQRDLSVGAGMIDEAIQTLPASRENADYLWKVVLRICKKYATGGIDDSNGTIGNCLSHIVQRLGEYAEEKPELRPIILEYCKDDTGFDFENDLKKLVKEKTNPING